MRTVLCSRVTGSIPFAQQFIHYMSKQDIVDYTVHWAQAVLEVHDASWYWLGEAGDALDPSCSPKDGEIHMNCIIEKRNV